MRLGGLAHDLRRAADGARRLSLALARVTCAQKPRRQRRPEASPRRFWTSEERATLRRLYPHLPTVEVARRMGRTHLAICAAAEAIGLRKTAEYLASPAACRLRRGGNVGAAHRFQKGRVPANKGLRRPGWYRGRMRDNWFEKGARPQTWVPVGTEVAGTDGYRKRKVSDDRTKPSRFNWKFVHVLVWEKAHGPVRAGHVVVFKNGDRAQIRLDNLELITRRELMRRNSVNRMPKVLAQAIQLRGALVRRIRRHDEKQDRRSA